MPKTFSDPITLGTLEFNGPRDPYGLMWWCDGLDGWEGTPAPVLATSQFTYSDGVAVASRSPLQGRYIEVQGVIRAPDRTLADAAFRRMQEEFAPDRVFDAIRHGPVVERMEVQIAGEITKIKDIGHAFRYGFTLLAPWPYKESTVPHTGLAGTFFGGDYYRRYPRRYPLRYTTDQATMNPDIPTSIALPNNGNAPAYLITEVQGPLPANGWHISVDTTGQQQTFGLAIGEGQTLRVDNRRQVATLEGAVVDYYIRGDWLRIPPHKTSNVSLVAADPAPAARLRATAADTWR